MEKYVQTHNKGRATRSSCLLRIWTSKLMLLTLLAGWNHFFLCLNKFLFLSVTNGIKKEKRKESRTKTCNKRLVYQHLGVDVKSCFSDKKIDFNQPMACGAPVRWSKYTTAVSLYLGPKVADLSHKRGSVRFGLGQDWFGGGVGGVLCVWAVWCASDESINLHYHD